MCLFQFNTRANMDRCKQREAFKEDWKSNSWLKSNFLGFVGQLRTGWQEFRKTLTDGKWAVCCYFEQTGNLLTNRFSNESFPVNLDNVHNFISSKVFIFFVIVIFVSILPFFGRSVGRLIVWLRANTWNSPWFVALNLSLCRLICFYFFFFPSSPSLPSLHLRLPVRRSCRYVWWVFAHFLPQIDVRAHRRGKARINISMDGLNTRTCTQTRGEEGS